MQTSPDLQNFHKIASLFTLAIIAALIAYLFWDLALPRKDFYNELWGPAYLLVHGQSPYHTAPLNPNLPAAWLPMSIGFFFPLGWIPETPALQVWYALTIIELAIIVYLALGEKINLPATIAAALMVFFFPLTLNHINLGQFSVTAALCWILAIQTSEFLKNSEVLGKWISAFLIALALSKPHLGIPALLGFSYHHYAARGGLRPMLLLWARIGIASLLLCLPLFIAYPNWIPDMITAMSQNPAWAYPSIFVFFRKTFGNWGWIFWVFTTLLVVMINFQFWKRLPAKNALYWSLALAPLVTPYVGSWDFVVLLPLMVFTYANVNWKRKTFIWVAYVIAWGIMARIQALPGSLNYYFWWVPLWFIGAMTIATFFRKSDNPFWK
jgi:hypothetical protein